MFNTTALIIISILCLIVSGCNQDAHEELPSIVVDKSIIDYQFSDFNLSQGVKYWHIFEIRNQENFPFAEGELDDIYGSTLVSYDISIFESLSEEEKDAIRFSRADTGFSARDCGAIPNCFTIYGASVAEQKVNFITTRAELMQLFVNINTEAELNIWLWAHKYYIEKYQLMNSGFKVIALKDGECSPLHSYLLFVDFNGVITVEKPLEQPEPTVCN